MKKIKVMTVPGTRPDAIKLAPLIKALEKDENIQSVVCVTAQHREMLDQVLHTFDIKPDYDLDIMKNRQSLNDVMAAVVSEIKPILQKEKPDLVLVHGDTATSFAAALAAFYEKIDVGHVEAGLRTGNRYSPFPEEMNRNLTSKIARLHFAPTEVNKQNLIKEGVDEDWIFVCGNTVIDAILSVVKQDYAFENKEVQRAVSEGRRIVLLTSHRRENQGEPMRECFQAMRELADEFEDVQIIYPIHLNPVVREIAKPILMNHPRISLIEPMKYQDFANLMAASHLIFTDSGGIQEEAPALDVPVVVLRTETERPEGLKAGTLLLAGVEKRGIVDIGRRLLNDKAFYADISTATNPYGDGESSNKIIGIINKQYEKL